MRGRLLDERRIPHAGELTRHELLVENYDCAISLSLGTTLEQHEKTSSIAVETTLVRGKRRDQEYARGQQTEREKDSGGECMGGEPDDKGEAKAY